jgi:hypothetical protein
MMSNTLAPRFTWARRVAAACRTVVVVLACLVISGCLVLLGIFVFDPDGSEEWTVGRRPNQYFTDIDHDLRTFSNDAYGAIWGVAHNSGGSIEATLEARINGADVIEVDVVELDGVLYSAHTPPLPFLGQRWFRGPRLERVWAASFGADAVMLDLKETSPGYVRLVGDFLESRPPTRQVIVSSRSPWILQLLRVRAPDTVLLLSVPDDTVLRAMQNNEDLLETIDGITVRHTVLDAENAVWLSDRGLLVFAWTVNDLKRVNELMRLGVDGITSDNLAIINLFAGDVPGEREMRRPSSTPPIENQNE